MSIPIGGNVLKEKAKKFAEKLGHKDFKSSNGWLESQKIPHVRQKSSIDNIIGNGISNLTTLKQKIIET